MSQRKQISWREFLSWSVAKVVETEEQTLDGGWHMIFHEGSECWLESDYDHGYSEFTPGEGIMPPKVYILESKR